MSDQRFERSIADALLEDDPGTVPARLQARMTAIPDEVAREGAVGWPRRLAGTLMAAAAVVALVVGLGLIGPGLLRGIPIGSGTLSSGVSGAVVSPPAASAVASASPDGQASSPASARPSESAAAPASVLITSSMIHQLMDGTFAVRDGIAYAFRRSDTVSDPILSSTDVTTGLGSTKTLVFLQNGHDIVAYALADQGIVWMETWYTQAAIDCSTVTPCTPHQGQPVSWSLNVTPLTGGGTTRLDGGVVSRTSVGGAAAGPLPPEMAAAGDRVAYAVPRLRVAGQPEASTIVVRSLSSGEVVRRITTRGYVAQLGVWGQAVMYREAQDVGPGAGTVYPGDATLRLAVSDADEPRGVEVHVSWATIGDGGIAGDDRIAWTSSDPAASQLRVARLADLTTTLVDAPQVSQAAGGAGAVGTAYRPTLVGDGAAWVVQVQDGSGAWSGVVDVWHPGWATGRPVPAMGAPDRLLALDGDLAWTGPDNPLTDGGVVGVVTAADLWGTP